MFSQLGQLLTVGCLFLFYKCSVRLPFQSSLVDKSFVSQNNIDTYFAPKATEVISIDGLPNELAWNKAPAFASFVDIINGSLSTSQTEAKALWDDENIYFYFKLYESHIWANLNKRDTTLYQEPCIEIFLDPDNDSRDYIEIEINPLEQIMDLKMNKPYNQNGSADIDFDLEHIQFKINHNGTINNASDRDNYWQLELALPRANISSSSEITEMRIHLARIHWEHEVIDGKYSVKSNTKPRISCWKAQGAFDNHIPENWGIINLKK